MVPMAFNWDPITVVNLVLCIFIVVWGIEGYLKHKSKTSLFIGIAFGLFGLSHLATILGWKDILQVLLILIRTVAYLLVVYTLYTFAKGKHK